MQRSVRAVRSPRSVDLRRASPGMCTDSERGGGRPGAPALSVGLDGLGGGTTLGARSGLRLHDSGCPFRRSFLRRWLLVSADALIPLAEYEFQPGRK
jgi:hypothetical protein